MFFRGPFLSRSYISYKVNVRYSTFKIIIHVDDTQLYTTIKNQNCFANLSDMRKCVTKLGMDEMQYAKAEWLQDIIDCLDLSITSIYLLNRTFRLMIQR